MTRKPLILAAALSLMAAGAFAQNTKGTGAETPTSTHTNPMGTVGQTTPSDGRSHADSKAGKNDRAMDATRQAQDDYEKKGKSGASLR